MIHHGDCLEVMATMPKACIDSVVTDPPYGLSFMGKAWDHGVPGVPFWEAALRVAKPGAMLLAFGGTRTFHRLTCAIEDAGWEIRDCLMWLYGSGFPKSHDISKAMGNKLWHGWGTALKPAWEPIILAMKPLAGTFAANAAEHGVAGLHIDGCRIHSGTSSGGDKSGGTALGQGSGWNQHENRTTGIDRSMAAGRWPANVILDEEAGAMLDEQSGESQSPATYTRTTKSENKTAYSPGIGEHAGSVSLNYGDKGGASRFFYCAKASKSEKGAGNTHPTVKPLKLMEYLCKLTATPTGGVVLDPFCGSGSTLVAAQNVGRDFIGIELNSEYVEIARARTAQLYRQGSQTRFAAL
jgi:site-specific DNA-methyltransferase (adenine-specific)